MSLIYSALICSLVLNTHLSIALAAEPALPLQKTEKHIPEGGAIVRPRVFFISPKDGDTVKAGKLKVKFGVEGMKVAKAGVMEAGSGHHHLLIDVPPVPRGQAVASSASHLHFGDGASEAEITLAPGPHTLTLQFADGAHMSYGEDMSHTIKITVSSAKK